MSNRDVLINFKVTESEKQKFEEYVENTNEFDSLSRMFRALAHRHIESGDKPEATVDTDEIVDAVDVAMSDVSERLERIEDNIAELDSQVNVDDSVSRLASDVANELPVHGSGEELPTPSTDIDTAPVDSLQMAQQLSTADAWADYYDVEHDRMRRALARALDFPDVKFVELGDSRRYYKTGGGE
jgi:hypothetical protein